MTIVKLMYPEDVGTRRYENRRLTFEVTDQPTRRSNSNGDLLRTVRDSSSNNTNAISVDDETVSQCLSEDSLTNDVKSSGLIGTVVKGAGAIVGGASSLASTMGLVDDGEDAPVSTLGAIQLPLPAQIQIDDAHSWTSKTGVPKALASVANNMAKKLLGEALAGEGAQTWMQYAMQLKTGAQYTVDPSYWLMYEGTGPRTVSMTFNFLPLNHKEAENVLKIIQFFKSYSAPRLQANDIVLRAPYFWQIKYDSDEIGAVTNFDNCVITNINTTLGDSAEIGVYEDGMPKFIAMSLTIQESQPPYRNEYTTGEKKSTSVPTNTGSQSTSTTSTESTAKTTSTGKKNTKTEETENKTATATPYSPSQSMVNCGSGGNLVATFGKDSAKTGPQGWGDLWNSATSWFKNGVKNEAEEREQKRQDYMNELSKG